MNILLTLVFHAKFGTFRTEIWQGALDILNVLVLILHVLKLTFHVPHLLTLKE